MCFIVIYLQVIIVLDVLNLLTGVIIFFVLVVKVCIKKYVKSCILKHIHQACLKIQCNAFLFRTV